MACTNAIPEVEYMPNTEDFNVKLFQKKKIVVFKTYRQMRIKIEDIKN